MADTDDADGPLDPRIQIELENLNSATDDINKLEIELDEANSTFKQLLSDSTKQLQELVNKIGHSCIEKSRCYYEAIEVSRQAQIQCQHQAHLYQRASEIHAAAKETVALAEARFISHKHEWNFDQAWQDTLNHATIQVMDAENQKAECGREHHRKAVLFHDADKKAQQLEEKYRRAIIKARPYFDVLAQCEQKLAQQKEKVQCLEKAVKLAKRTYAESFRALEEISNEIHQQRRELSIMVNGPREPGVGAELITPDASLDYKDELNRVTAGRLSSLTNSEADSDERTRDIEDVNELKDRMENLSGRSVDGSESTSNQWELELQASMEKLNILSLKKFNSYDLPETLTESKVPIDKLDCSIDKTSSLSVSSGSQASKLPIDSIELLKKPTGWQSLSQSPINSILNKSKLAINNFSKSLTSSPVNAAFSFTKLKDNQVKLSTDNNNKSNESTNELSDNKKNYFDNNSNGLNNEFNINTVPSNDGEFKVINNNNNFISTSADASPVKLMPINNINNNENPDVKFVDNPQLRQPSSKISSVKELPLLSMFDRSNSLRMSRDRSCSMINLDDKNTIKSVLDNTDLKNIQAVSVERLACARNILIADK
ncbi:SH3 domain-binding protein 5 homolog [Microplitis mediator]|uniref:SH3 domain-binding protein 5 homolog n=1 Tax=Microplitis mediator TaxID=375433 RepID=UPI002556931D|nr:SH3 domain-binding protein 5 homolog [Microplitis mediator]